eukprot:TRINITY_DN4215_c0_g1_i3.p1 TRINITY_DN4215_c0_g1~~TRINITY_DN4215_c0_g1_i3.p1  ORF type:complete len:183 (-),score=24.87 TRINITY_DN4215_c0_g1_i3:142-690(-)
MWAYTYKSSEIPKRDEWDKAHTTSELRHHREKLPDRHPMHEISERTPLDGLLHFSMYYRDPKEKWSEGRVVLLGDSCHATLPFVGQGANMAVEDAYVLAQSFVRSDFEIGAAFHDYFERRFKRTKDVVESAKTIGTMIHGGGLVAETLRRWILPRLITSKSFTDFASRSFYKNAPVELPPKI